MKPDTVITSILRLEFVENRKGRVTYENSQKSDFNLKHQSKTCIINLFLFFNFLIL